MKPTYRAARNLALEAAQRRMKEAGRERPNREDERFIRAEVARLLFHVEAEDGGFLGLSDSQREKRAHELMLPLDLVIAAAWAPGQWPQGAVA